MKLKHACTDAGQYGLNVTPDAYRTEGIRFVRTSDLVGGVLSPEGIYVDGPVQPRYQLMPGDLLLSRAGTVGRAFRTPETAAGAAFAGFLVRFRPRDLGWSRYLYYVTQSQAFQDQVLAGSTLSTIQNFNAERYANVDIPFATVRDRQRIADLLDEQISRVDTIVRLRDHQVSLIQDAFSGRTLQTLGGRTTSGPRKRSSLRWLGDVPASWPVLAVSTQFETALGKMLDDRQQTGLTPLPYLRNANVQWDRIDIEDLKIMDIAPNEYARCTVRAGDLLICEGGQPGRAAVWDGRIERLGFQKALHRARSRGRSDPRWLLHCLRAAVSMNAFAGENGVTTIGHLTGEQLREQRFPFPEPEIQRPLVAELDTAMAARDRTVAALERSVSLLLEYKQSLITAAVSGEFDVTTASGRGMPT